MAIKKGDNVLVISGKDKGKSGKVVKVFPNEGKVVVEGINLRKKTRRPRKQGEKGQVIQISAPVRKSNVLLVCPSCGKTTRKAAGFSESGEKMRLCKKCGNKFL